MNINTGKLASNSSSVLKRLKENEAKNKISKIHDNKNEIFSEKLFKDFLDIKINDKTFRTRLVNLNNSLSEYENELSKAQFIEQKINLIESHFQKNEKEQIKQIIKNNTYNNEKVLKDYFYSKNNIEEQIQEAKQLLDNKYSQLHKEFKVIEVISQNIFSLYSYPMNVSDRSIKGLNLNDLIKSTKLSNKRVVDLIS